MASSKNRQRALARAKLERQIARRAAAARRRRQVQAGIGAGLAVVLVVAGIVWLAGGFKPKKTRHSTAATECAWTPQSGNPDLKDVGKPPTTGIAHSGAEVMTITTNQGVIEAQLDPQRAPCTVASFQYLAGKQFFDNTNCFRLTTQGIYVLQCGDPSGTGRGGPTYRFPDEFLPTGAEPASPAPSPGAEGNLYPKGSLAMANSGPDTNGSQFFIVYRDGSALEAKYTLFGTITKGLDIVEKIAAGGVNAKDPSNPNDGAPKTDLTIQSVTVAPLAATAPPSAEPGTAPSTASTP